MRKVKKKPLEKCSKKSLVGTMCCDRKKRKRGAYNEEKRAGRGWAVVYNFGGKRRKKNRVKKALCNSIVTVGRSLRKGSGLGGKKGETGGLGGARERCDSARKNSHTYGGGKEEGTCCLLKVEWRRKKRGGVPEKNKQWAL